MTVNVALVTSEALILGCDSIASTRGYYLNPFKFPLEPDEEGKYVLKFTFDDIERPVVDVRSGVTKMFPIHEGESPVAAVTSGVAKLNDKTMRAIAEEYLRRRAGMSKTLVNVHAIANDFLRFVRKEYEDNYKDSELKEPFWDGPEFLVGGFGRDDSFPSLFRIRVKENEIFPHFTRDRGANDGAGIAWNGQASAVERWAKGYDVRLTAKINDAFDQHRKDMTEVMIRVLAEILEKLEAEMPGGVETTLPDKPDLDAIWSAVNLPIDYSNLPEQDGVELVAHLVNMQSGRDKFASGVATVGGRTHIGIVTKSKGFRMLNEPEVVHQHVGFGDHA